MSYAPSSPYAHARAVADVTEADEASATTTGALARLGAIVRAGETFGVIAMYEEAALRLGATWTEIDAVTRQARTT